MKNIKILFLLFAFVLFSCTQDAEVADLSNISNPSELALAMAIKTDNSGTVTFTPSGTGISEFDIYYGDGTTTAGNIAVGSNISHVYKEGTFQVKLVGKTLNGKTTEKTFPLTVTFVAPTNLVATIEQMTTNSMGFTVKATANLETGFKVTYGDVPNETPVMFLEGDSVSHIYTTPGTYTITVTAYTGGVAQAVTTKQVTATIPTIIGLPLDFESSTLTYTFTSFGGANSVVAANANSAGINTSNKVGKLTKGNGSEVWAGSFIELSNPIDFSSMKKLKMKVWSPKANIVVKMKLENFANNTINKEVDATLTTANGWQELTFDFSSIDTSKTYQRVVVFFDFGVAGNGNVYYFDDIKQSN